MARDRGARPLDLSSPPLHYKQLRGELQHKTGGKGTKRKPRSKTREMATRLGTAACYIYERESQDCFCLVTNTIAAAVCILQEEEEEEEEGWDRGVVHFKGDPSSLSTTLLSVCLSFFLSVCPF